MIKPLFHVYVQFSIERGVFYVGMVSDKNFSKVKHVTSKDNTERAKYIRELKQRFLPMGTEIVFSSPNRNDVVHVRNTFMHLYGTSLTNKYEKSFALLELTL